MRRDSPPFWCEPGDAHPAHDRDEPEGRSKSNETSRFERCGQACRAGQALIQPDANLLLELVVVASDLVRGLAPAGAPIPLTKMICTTRDPVAKRKKNSSISSGLPPSSVVRPDPRPRSSALILVLYICRASLRHKDYGNAPVRSRWRTTGRIRGRVHLRRCSGDTLHTRPGGHTIPKRKFLCFAVLLLAPNGAVTK
jgi:hypothetical protein